MEGSKIETIPEVKINETTMAEEESHHWRRSLRCQLFPDASMALLPRSQNRFMIKLDRPLVVSRYNLFSVPKPRRQVVIGYRCRPGYCEDGANHSQVVGKPRIPVAVSCASTPLRMSSPTSWFNRSVTAVERPEPGRFSTRGSDISSPLSSANQVFRTGSCWASIVSNRKPIPIPVTE